MSSPHLGLLQLLKELLVVPQTLQVVDVTFRVYSLAVVLEDSLVVPHTAETTQLFLLHITPPF